MFTVFYSKPYTTGTFELIVPCTVAVPLIPKTPYSAVCYIQPATIMVADWGYVYDIRRYTYSQSRTVFLERKHPIKENGPPESQYSVSSSCDHNAETAHQIWCSFNLILFRSYSHSYHMIQSFETSIVSASAQEQRTKRATLPIICARVI